MSRGNVSGGNVLPPNPLIFDFRISAGKFAASQPGTIAIQIKGSRFGLSPDVYSSIAKVIGANDYGYIPCDNKVNIVFTIGGMDLTLTPEYYIDRSNVFNGYCSFLGHVYSDDRFFTLPYTVFHDHCLLLDFKNKQVGFANKKK
jgi:hypothetical protein